MLDLFSLSQVRERERDHNSLKFYIKNAEFAGACYSMPHLTRRFYVQILLLRLEKIVADDLVHVLGSRKPIK